MPTAAALLIAAATVGWTPTQPLPPKRSSPLAAAVVRRRAPLITAKSSPPPPDTSGVLLVGDAGALLMYFLGLSTVRTFALPVEIGDRSDVTTFLLESKLDLTVQYVAIESLSAVALTLAWLVGATLGGALTVDWFELAREERTSRAPFGVARTLLRSWAYAIPLAELGKACAVAAVILPVGGWLAFDMKTAVADLGGMLFTVALWREVLLRL